jgi:plastocyanin
MRLFGWAAAAAMLLLPLSGCMDPGGDYTPRTHEFTLEVKPGMGSAIPLYTLNDGVSQMNVIAMGFSTPDQQTLTVPNPEIRVKEGDTVILHIVNNSPLTHTLHLHGGLQTWENDGVPFLTQPPIHQGESYTYVFEDLKAGTYFYHCHVDVAHHIDLGMYGAFIVEEVDPPIDADREFVLMLDEWDNCHVHGNSEPITAFEQSGHITHRIECLQRLLQDNLAQNTLTSTVLLNPALDPARGPFCDAVAGLPPDVQAQVEPITRQLGCGGGHAPIPIQQSERTWWPETHPVYAPEYNTFLINGKAFPDTTPMPVREGETVRVRLINVGEQMHSMHVHGHNMLVAYRDGYKLDSPFRVDTLGIMPGERYDVFITMDNPGLWMFHDHVSLNGMNDDHDPGGMMTCIAYDGFHDTDVFAFERAIDCNNRAIEIFAMTDHGHGGRARN